VRGARVRGARVRGCGGAILRGEPTAATDLYLPRRVNPEQAYERLVALSREETLLASCLDLLEWDEEVCMPPSGVAHRAEQRALLAGMVHDRATDPRYDDLLAAIEGSSLVADPESAEAVNVREIRRSFDRERRLPRKLVALAARVTAISQQTWGQARLNDDYPSFAPWLDRIFALARERADAKPRRFVHPAASAPERRCLRAQRSSDMSRRSANASSQMRCTIVA